MILRLSTFLAGSVVAQGTAALTGLLLARWLPVHQYALYTVTTAIMGAMTLLTKGGVHLGYTTLLGRDWPDLTKVDAAGRIALRIRRLMSAIMLPPICIVSVALLLQNGARKDQVAILIALLLLSWFFDMQTRVIDQVLFFARQTSRVQILDTVLSLIRLAATVVLHATMILDMVLAVALSVIIAAMRVLPVKRWIMRVVPPIPDNRYSNLDYTMVRKIALRQVPIEIFSVFQVQIVIFCLTFFSGSSSVADYGAITRIAQLLLPIQAMSYSFVIPIFSRVKAKVLRSYLLYSSLCTLPSVFLVTLSWAFPEYLLLLVGSKYAGLEHELFIAMLNAAMLSSTSVAWNLLAHRGLNSFAWLQIPVGVGWCLLAPLFLDVTKLSGALWLQAGFSLGYLTSIVADVLAARRRREI